MNPSRRVRSATVLMLIACGSAVIVNAQSRRPPQRLLGVGTLPTAPAVAPAAPSAADPFFDDNVLQELSLDINAKDWATLKENFESNAYYPADLRWRGQVVRNVGIRSRGTSSRSGTKPGLRVDFNRYSTGQTFLGLKSFVLRNNVTDATNLHERISMLFFRKMGIPAPRETHTRLTVNGTYAGLYSIVESLDQTFLAANYGSDSGYLYKFDRNVDDPPYYFEYLGPDPAAYVPHPFEPETHESDPHPQPIVDMMRTVQEASPAAFRSAIAGLIDVTQFVRYIAVEMFLGDNDGFLGNAGSNNFYLYRPHDAALQVLVPWDKSEAMHDGPLYPILHTLNDVPDANRNHLMLRLMAQADLRALYFNTLNAAAAVAIEPETEGGPGWMEREIDRELHQIKDAAIADPDKPFTDAQFDAAINELLKFARERSEFVASEVDRLDDTDPYWAIP